MIDVWQYSEYGLGSEYGTVLNMLGLHKVVNKISHHRLLTGSRICFEFLGSSLGSQYVKA